MPIPFLGPLIGAAGSVLASVAGAKAAPQASSNDQSGKHFWRSLKFNRKEAIKARKFSAQ